MSFYNTGNPVPSIDPRDLDDNAKHVDELVNSTLPTFVDRLGTERRTLAGIEADADAIVLRDDLAEPDGSSLVGYELSPLTVAIAMAPKVERALLALPVSLWQFIDSVTTKPNPTDMSTWDWTPAFNAMYRYISDTYSQGGLKYGKSAWIPPLPNGTYKVRDQNILIPRKGIATIGEGSQTSVIEFSAGSTATWGILAQNEAISGNMGGTSFIRIGIDCAGVAVGGLNLEDGYDNVIFDDVRISRVHPDKIGLRMGPRTDGNPGQPLSQTINSRGLFVYKDGAGATVPPIVLIKVQESQFIGCKSWAGGFGGAGRGNTPAWYLEDCRSVHLQDCSSVGAQNFGVEVRAETKSSDGINITGHLYENCNGTLKTSSSNATTFPLKSLFHGLARIESPSSGGFDLGGLSGGIIEAGVTSGTIQADSDQCQVNMQHLPNWSDLSTGSKRSVFRASPNAVANYSATNKETAVVAPLSTPRTTLRRGDSADYVGYEWSSSAGAENGWRNFQVVGGTQHNVFRGDHSRTFFGPGVDNVYSFGLAAFRCTVLWAASGTISTSDGREKTLVRELTEFEIAAAKALGKEIGIYKWLAEIQKKDDKARSHVGMAVQRAIEIMEAHDLDPFEYGFICHDEWDASPEILNEDGEVTEPAREAGDRFSFRMDELYAFIAAGLEARISALESL